MLPAAEARRKTSIPGFIFSQQKNLPDDIGKACIFFEVIKLF